MRSEDPQTIYLKDYAPSAYRIERVELDVDIAPDTSRVRALLTISPARRAPRPIRRWSSTATSSNLKSIAIDGAPLVQSAFVATPDSLTIVAPPNRTFVLETEVVLEPEKNTRLMGLYRSSGTWCTQCEPEGFRRITYYLDRPDVLSVFKVTMTADKTLAPGAPRQRQSRRAGRHRRHRQALRGLGRPASRSRPISSRWSRATSARSTTASPPPPAARSRSASTASTARRTCASTPWTR